MLNKSLVMSSIGTINTLLRNISPSAVCDLIYKNSLKIGLVLLLDCVDFSSEFLSNKIMYICYV